MNVLPSLESKNGSFVPGKQSSRIISLICFGLMLVHLFLKLAYCREFCGHSSYESSHHSTRIKRLAPQQRAGRQLTSESPQVEDQIVIDETDSAVGSSASSTPATTGARVSQDCTKSRLGSEDCPQPVKTIETAVFLDQELDNKFNGMSNGLVELNKLVLTIMNQVQHLFRYSSMKVPIKIKLVLVEHLRDSEKRGGGRMPNSERGDIDAYLANFCNWQQRRLDREKRLWWDHAILLSG